ncbi:1-phosphatidylinositol 4,5-bisphosphate phosphodiesterase [Gryllus bimaculatus]|nr:1-phosphatidylinositol 4,5-bisphosphate phosphodiesterase [Gryllus bimaculatus]
MCQSVFEGRMAGTKNTAHVVQLKPVEVPKSLQDGEKFIKWDEDSGVGTPVTLRVDKDGFYLYWMDQNKELDMLDIATIRDTRTGKHAKIPKDPKLKQIVTMGLQDTLEEKTVTICYGSDFVNLSFINFCCTKKEIAELWTDGLIVKLFAQNKEDRKRVEKALDIAGLPSGKNDAVSLQKFQFEDFFNFYKCLTHRSEVEKIFDELCGGTSKRRLMSAAQFMEFLNKTQRDPRLNEILYPYANTARSRDLIQQYEPNKYNAQRETSNPDDGDDDNDNSGQFSFDGFLRYLMSEDNPIMSYSKFDLSDDMDQPLPHYFINSSHNTYLAGHQLTGKASVEMYRQCLLAGCRCVELDFWNGRTEEPVIVHGYTFVPEISAREVIEAIAESAFKTSDYPVVLSFENHCNPRQQAKIASYCRDIFGEMLLDAPLESHKLEPGQCLPPPSLLKRKIIIKNKKKHHHHHHKKSRANSQWSLTAGEGAAAGEGDVTVQGNGDVPHMPAAPPRQGSKDSGPEEEDNEDDDESSSGEELEDENPEKSLHEKSSPTDKSVTAPETEAGDEISALVNYVQPVHFLSFENSEKKNRYYEMSSFDEKQATTLLKESPIEFVNYNKNQLSRVYPSGKRFDSSNFMPQVFWNAGCQLVALNYQTLDLAMQLNLGIFEYNHRCGYLLKPEFMRRRDRRLDPFAESTVDGIIAGTVSVHIISAQFLTDKRVGTFIEVDMYGLPADTVRKKFRTKIVPNNGINPVFDEEPFVFKKVVLPELASIRLAAYEESNRLIGHRVLPVVGLCPGYRHVALRTELGQPLPLAAVFLHIVVKDYVPDGLSDFAEALANPIKYQSELEKRAQQLSVLTDDMDVIEQEDETSKLNAKRIPSDKQEVAAAAAVATSVAAAGNHVVSVSPGPRASVVTAATAAAATTAAAPDVETRRNTELVDSQLPATVVCLEAEPSTAGPPVERPPASMSDELVAEPLERIMESKGVREKRLELDKKLEALRKKQEKERMRIQMHKGSQDEKSKSKFYTAKLVKRLSSKNIDLPPLSVASEPVDCGESGDPSRYTLPRSQSERLLAICKTHVNQERELQEKYHDLVFSTAEKALRTSQSQQLKLLQVLLERETDEVMRKLQALRRDEVKALSKVHRDKDEMVRMKREVASAMVDRGVQERMRLTQLYQKRREELEHQHELVRTNFEEERKKAKAGLIREYEGRYARVEEDVIAAATSRASVDVSFEN